MGSDDKRVQRVHITLNANDTHNAMLLMSSSCSSPQLMLKHRMGERWSMMLDACIQRFMTTLHSKFETTDVMQKGRPHGVNMLLGPTATNDPDGARKDVLRQVRLGEFAATRLPVDNPSNRCNAQRRSFHVLAFTTWRGGAKLHEAGGLWRLVNTMRKFKWELRTTIRPP